MPGTGRNHGVVTSGVVVGIILAHRGGTGC